jgi:hypothetical protein
MENQYIGDILSHDTEYHDMFLLLKVQYIVIFCSHLKTLYIRAKKEYNLTNNFK